MAYSTGSTILDDDYNIFATGNAAGTGDASVANINTILGDGDNERGYGQTGGVAPVTAGGTVVASEWANLLTKNTLLANHQGTTLSSITNPSAGDTISAYAALSANITATFDAKLDAAGSGSDITRTTTSTASWNTSSTLSQTITFPSRDQMRYFFNAGGMIRCSWSRTGGTASSQNTAWTDTLTAAGSIVLTSDGASKTIAGVTYTGTTKIGGSGTNQILLTANGIYDVAATPVIYFKQIPPSGYGDNEIEYYLSIPVGGSVLTVFTDLSDDYTPPDPGSPDLVDGTLTQTLIARLPSTTYLADTWGTPTISSNSWVQS